MLFYHSIICALFTIGLALAEPISNDKQGTESQDVSILIRQELNTTEACGRMKEIWYPTAEDWRDHETTEWFSDWIDKNVANDSSVRLDAAWGGWAFGNPLWDCADDGSDGCELPDFCNKSVYFSAFISSLVNSTEHGSTLGDADSEAYLVRF